MQVKLMNVITSYTPLSTNVVRLIAIQIYVVFTSVVRFTDDVQCNLSRCVQVYKYGVGYDIYYTCNEPKYPVNGTIVLTLIFYSPTNPYTLD